MIAARVDDHVRRCRHVALDAAGAGAAGLVEVVRGRRELRRQVTSPGGTTEAALAAMESNGLEETVGRGIHAAIERSDELATQLGEE